VDEPDENGPENGGPDQTQDSANMRRHVKTQLGDDHEKKTGWIRVKETTQPFHARA